jgi:hypothetical protein
LYNGTPTQSSAFANGYPFYFTPYVAGSTPTGASFTIIASGTYRLYYGLVGVPSSALSGLIEDLYHNTCWLCIQIDHGGTGTSLTQIGAVPLTFTHTNNVMPPQTLSPVPGYFYLAGFGQVWTHLDTNDIVTLQIMLATGSVAATQILYIGPTNISYPTSTASPGGGTGIAGGPTLSIMKIADPS